jgi:hypothetical protein
VETSATTKAKEAITASTPHQFLELTYHIRGRTFSPLDYEQTPKGTADNEKKPAKKLGINGGGNSMLHNFQRSVNGMREAVAQSKKQDVKLPELT